jgi:hypothetical protein
MLKQVLNFLRSPKAMYIAMGLHLFGVLVSLVGTTNATNDLDIALVAIVNLLGVGFAYAMAKVFQNSDPDA